jgi:hypothetical protein
VVGKYAAMERKPVSGPEDPLAKGAGHLSGAFQGKPASVWLAHSTPDDPTPNSSIPAIVDFDEANGGEWRKSFHGYPRELSLAEVLKQCQISDPYLSYFRCQ